MVVCARAYCATYHLLLLALTSAFAGSESTDRNMNGGDLHRHKSRAFTIKAGDLTLLLLAERHPWEASRNAWVIGCGELLGGIALSRSAPLHQETQLSKK